MNEFNLKATTNEHPQVVQTPVQHAEQAVQDVQRADHESDAEREREREARADQRRAKSQVLAALRTLQDEFGGRVSAAELEAHRQPAARTRPTKRRSGKANALVATVARATQASTIGEFRTRVRVSRMRTHAAICRARAQDQVRE